jgi:hypothetical protein
MTPMTVIWTVLVPLAAKSPPASKVKPGWLAFWIIMAMLAAVFLLGLSLNKHLKRVNFVEEPEDPDDRADPDSATRS